MLNIDPMILIKYFSRIDLSPGKKSKLSEDIATALRDPAWKEKLAKVIKDNATVVSPVILKEVLESTKRYLQGRDFDCPLRFQSTSYLFGLIRRVTETDFLNPYLIYFDDLISNLAPTAFSTPAASTTIHLHTPPSKNSMLILLALGLVALPYCLAETTEAKLIPKKTSFEKACLPCDPFDEFQDHFYVLSNGPTQIRTAKFVGYGDAHTNPNYLLWISQILDNHATPGDTVLTEGDYDFDPKDCRQIQFLSRLKVENVTCVSWEDKDAHAAAVKSNNQAVLNKENAIANARNLLNEKEWIKTFLKKAITKNTENFKKDLDIVIAKLKKLWAKVANKKEINFDEISTLWKNKKFQPIIDTIFKSINDLIQFQIHKAEAAVIEETNLLLSHGKNRNRFFLRNIYKHANQKNKNQGHGIAGREHFVTERFPYDTKINKDDPQFEFHQGLQIPSVFLIARETMEDAQKQMDDDYHSRTNFLRGPART